MAQAIFFIYCRHTLLLQSHINKKYFTNSFFPAALINTRECTQMIYELLFVSYLWIFLRPFGGGRAERMII